jgi:hypothetical protein
MMLHVGQKVVCIKEGLWSWERDYPNEVRRYGIVHARKGNILTIRDIDSDEIGYLLRFHEIINPPTPTRKGICEICFCAKQFRPLIERKTDISVFTEVLKDKALTLDKSLS